MDTKSHLADLLTEGSFTRNEWCNLLGVFHMLYISLFSRSHFRSVEKATTMSKRTKERKMEAELEVSVIDFNKPEQRAILFFGSGCFREAAENCERNFVRNSPKTRTCSQVWKGDNLSQRSCGKLQRKIEIQLQTTRLDHHNLQVTENEHVRESLHESSSKVESIGG